MGIFKIVCAMVLCSIIVPVMAAKGGNTGGKVNLEEQVSALEAEVASQAQTIAQLQTDISAIYSQLSSNTGSVSALDSRMGSAEGRLDAAETRLDTIEQSSGGGGLPPEVVAIFDHLSLDQGTNTMLFHGVNVQIVNGQYSTNGPVNGVGNLIIGYNENYSGKQRAGSHNLVLGSENGYGASGSLVVGSNNQINASDAAIIGGVNNLVTGERSVIVGGEDNVAEGPTSTLVGGTRNRASNFDDVVVGGTENHADGNGYGTQIFGGGHNITNSGTIYGGANNRTFDGEPYCDNPVIIGGDGNTNNGMRAVVVGGSENSILCDGGNSHGAVLVPVQ